MSESGSQGVIYIYWRKWREKIIVSSWKVKELVPGMRVKGEWMKWKRKKEEGRRSKTRSNIQGRE